jgi:glycosyltransferase involved in cell wall biosynthesis
MVEAETPQRSLRPQSAPVFSVVIPAYNAARHIGEALDSVFAQTFNDYEVIVVNDGSPDTVELEKLLQHHMHRIVYIRQQNNGPGGARNAAIMRSTGEYIAFLDSDDKWLPEHLADMMNVLRGDPTLDLVYADAVNFGDPTLAGRTSMEMNPPEGVPNFESLIEEKCSVICSCAVARRQALIEVGMFDENLTHGEDFDLWLRLAYRGARIDYLRKIHSQRRIHHGSLTANPIHSFEGQVKVLRKLMRELTLSRVLKDTMKLEIERCYASIALEKGKRSLLARQYARAREEFQRADAFYRSRKLQLVLFLLRIAPHLLRHLYMRRESQAGRSLDVML